MSTKPSKSAVIRAMYATGSYTVAEIAMAVGCLPEYVRAEGRRKGPQGEGQRMTRVRAVTTWLDGRVALYATLGTLTTADRSCELVGRDQVALVRVLLEARGAYVARKVLADALGWSSPTVASRAVDRLCMTLLRSDMPLAVHRVQGLGYALTWVGERPGVDLRPAPAKILAPKPDAPTPLQRALAAPPPPKRSDHDEILRLRHPHGRKDTGMSVKQIARHIGWTEASVAAVLGVQWGRAS